MQYRDLGNSGLRVSSICMGCWAIVGDATWGPQDERDAVAAIHAALDAGINFFDSAEMYGSGYSEELLAKALKGRREQAVIATKVSSMKLKPEALREACNASLRRLQTDVIDLYQIHWPNWDLPIEEPLAALEDLKIAGKIRAYGVSNFGKRDLSDLLNKGRVESNQLPYSLLWRAIEHEVQPVCVEHNVSILTYCSLAQGLLTGKFKSADEVPEGRARTRHFSNDRPQARHGEPGCEAETFAAIEEVRRISESVGHTMSEVALAWLLAQPAVTSVIAGSRNAEQSRANARAAAVVLSEEVLTQLSQATDGVKQKLGTNPDAWQGVSRMR